MKLNIGTYWILVSPLFSLDSMVFDTSLTLYGCNWPRAYGWEGWRLDVEKQKEMQTMQQQVVMVLIQGTLKQLLIK